MRNSEDISGLQLAANGLNPEQMAMAGSERELMRLLVQALPETLRQPLVLSADEKALEAVRQYRFKPAMENGRPVPVELNVEIDFHIY